LVEKLKVKWVYLISVLYIALNAVLIANEIYWFSILPAIVLIFIFYFFALDKLLLIITLITPLAINIKDLDIGAAVSLPSEPLMFGVLLIFLINILHNNNYDIRISKHPVSIFIYFNLAWLLLTSITSEIPLVSFKFWIARLWFVIPFYFIAILIFKKIKNIRLFIWLYIIPLTGVIFYTVINHSQYGFEEDPGHWVMTPFYNDHTAYGAVLALFIPVISGFVITKSFNRAMRIFSFISLIILLGAIILSYSRAAWISVAISFLVMLIILLRLKLWMLLSGTGILIGLFMIYQQQIIMKLEKNKQDSSAHFVEHVQSISNISSDASNLERINRWQSAFRMFHERPFWGWGPGTYQFLYAPFQYSQEKTIISTNAGDKGNAHSEYIGPLAESGVIGMLSFLAIVITVLYTGIRVFRNAATKDIKILSLTIVLGLISYLSHGFLNNFLDTDKASVPFWGFIAVLVALDLFHNKRSPENSEIKDHSV